MSTSVLVDELRSARGRAERGSGRRAVLDRFHQMVEVVAAKAASPSTPPRTRRKLQEFEDHLCRAHQRLGARMCHVAFALNVVGEGMARADLVQREVLEFVQVGLYFFGLDQIERRWSSRAAVYSGIHAEHLQDFLSRKALKDLLAEARERMEGGRPFCLTYAYLNSLRKAYWRHCRASEDVLDVALTGESVGADDATTAPSDRKVPDPTDRVALMLDIFEHALSDRQRWIYLAKNRSGLHDLEAGGASPPGEMLLAAVLDGDAPPGHDLGWSEIARRLDINEKTAKREYLRSLHTLLEESARRVFGPGRIPSNYVRRILEQIRSIVYEKDLRIRSSTGRGMGTLVGKWEVALRFVLNHERVVA